MRVLHIEAGRHLYGGAAQVRYLVDGLASAGIDNVLLCARDGELADEPPAAPVIPLAMHGDLDVGLVPRVARAIRQVHPDVVHVHSRRGADLFGGLAATLTATPAVLTRRVESAEPQWFASRKYRAYAAVVVLSRAIEAELAAAGVPAARVVRIPSVVDTERFRPDAQSRDRVLAEFRLPADALVVAVVAQLIERKGHRHLLDALPDLVSAEPRLRVLCFGRGPLEPALARDLAARGLAGHVTLAGFRRDLPELMPGFDVLVHPAEREGLGLALIEAAAAGVPVVAFAAGGVPDVVEDGVTGALVPVADVAALKVAVARLLASPGERARLGTAARARAEQSFGIESLVAAHLSLYDRVLGERAGVAPSAVSR
jgi:glycosyltransferase involved in cell wall biosynthesis